MDAIAESTFLRERLRELAPEVHRLRQQARLIQVETVIADHDRLGWPTGEDDYKRRLLHEVSVLWMEHL